MSESGSSDKPFTISKQLVWKAYRRVAANKGAAGVDGQSVEDFEVDLKNNIFKIWNRMSSGTYFPPPVRAVEIPKPLGAGGAPVGRARAASLREVLGEQLTDPRKPRGVRHRLVSGRCSHLRTSTRTREISSPVA
ncbi:MAG: hypothetical protein ACRDRN_21460 [Sciscionella sp.]